jgi:isopenicillin-N N-acyltransferase-like protein
MARFWLLSALSATAALAAYCGGAPDPNAKPNTLPISTAAPTLLRSVPNGHAYVAGAAGFEFNVVHVYGSAYEMGYAQGALFPAEVASMLNRTWDYMVSQVDSGLAFLPAWLAELVGDVALEVALDVLIDLTRPSTGPYIYEELHGLAAGAGVDYQKLARVHLIGELTQGDCSLIGAWGGATAGGKTLQLRALDWDTNGPFRDYPATIVYHPTTPGAHPFVNVGLLAFIGTFTGQSSKQLGVSEIGVSYPDTTYFGTETFQGVPFVYALRDILEFDETYLDSVARLQHANRTCDLILAVGDGKAATARSFAYSGSELFVFDDKNLQPWNATPNTWHPRYPSVVWHAMDWL